MAPHSAPPRFVRDERELTEVRSELKLWSCPHCGRTETLIGHGYVRGYGEHGTTQEVRGRRIFCSNRQRRPGCGRTVSASLMTAMLGFVVRTLSLFRFAKAVLGGLTRRAAWLAEASGTFSLSSGYRLWRRLNAAQSALRTRLSGLAQAPACGEQRPLAQLLAHMEIVVGADGQERDLFAAFQLLMQRGLFDA